MLGKLFAGACLVGVGAVWALTAVAANDPAAATKARNDMVSGASAVVGGAGQVGGRTLYASSFVVQGGVMGIQNTGLGNMLTTTTVAGTQSAPAADGATATP